MSSHARPGGGWLQDRTGMTEALQLRQPMKTLQHRTISAATADELRRRILDGHFPAGFQLRQDALAEEFGVSRIPIREALVQLEAEGLVRIVPHKGAVVSELSIEEIEELFELRALIEPMLLRRSAPHLTEADYTALTAILDEYSAELRADHVSRWGELNTRFHQLLYRHAGRPRSLALVGTLLQESDRHARMQLTLTGGRERAETEHAELVALCRAGDLRTASALLKAHIDHVGRSLRDALRAR
jgi:DNA-binding GntR family transcriptional regulator